MKRKISIKRSKLLCLSVLCMAIAMMLTAFETNASDEQKNIIYQPDYTYSSDTYKDSTGAGIAPDAPSGYLFAGWYTSNGANNYKAVKTPEDNETYYAKFVPKEVLDIRAQVSGTLCDEATDNDATSAIRFLTSIDSTSYEKVGFKIKKGKNGIADDVNTSKYVYKTVYAVDATADNKGEVLKDYNPNEVFHSTSVYFKTWTIKNIQEAAYNTDITVTPYWVTLDGTRVEGTKSIKTVNLGRSWVYVNTSPNAEDSLQFGTRNHPFTEFDDALEAVFLTSNGKVIIQDNSTITTANDFTWEQSEKSRNITIIGENQETSKLDFSAISKLSINDGVIFDNITLILPTTVFANGHGFKIQDNVISENASTSIYGGGESTTVSKTNVEIYAGDYKEVWGGGKKCTISNDIHLTIKNANVFDDSGADKSRIFGSGANDTVKGDIFVTIGGTFNQKYDVAEFERTNILTTHKRYSSVHGAGSGTVEGNTYVRIEDQAEVDYVYGGGGANSEVKGTCYVELKGGTVFSIYGGGKGDNSSTAGKNADTSVVVTGGKVCQIIGGNGNSMTGNSYVEIAGGQVTRRIYGGCYNDVSETNAHHVTGYSTVVIKDETAVANLSGLDAGIIAGSRSTAEYSDEIAVLICNNDSYASLKDDLLTSYNEYDYLVQANAGGVVSSIGTRLSVTPNDENNAIVRLDNSTSGKLHAYMTSKGMSILPELNTDTGKREVYVVFGTEQLDTETLSGYEAKVGGTHFDTLENAIAEAKALSTADEMAVVTLLKDVEIDAAISVSSSDNLTVQSEGDNTYTITAPTTASSTDQNVFTVGGTLTINNVATVGGYHGIRVTGTGKVYSANGVSISNTVKKGLYVYGGTADMCGLAVSETGEQALHFESSAKATISDYTVVATSSSVAVRIMSGSDVTLIDGTINANKTYGIYMDGDSSKVIATDTRVIRGVNNTTNPLVSVASVTSQLTFNQSESGEAYIDGKSYGGRGVEVKGTFALNGGTIRNNTAETGAGVMVNDSATFTMTGGTISGNTATSTTSGGGGVYVAENGTFNMNTPEIEGATAGTIKENVSAKYGAGVFVLGTFNMDAGTISNHGSSTSNRLAVEGTGVCLSGTSATFNMNGGEISNNYASSPGAGVSMLGGNATYPVFTMTGGSITGNYTSGAAAGIIVRTGEVTMTGGSISNNTAGGNGGGAYVTSKFTMAGGTISTNTANKSDGGGGGVYVNDAGTFTMSSGTISQNTTANYGGGVYVKTNGTFNMNAPESEGMLASEIKANVTASSKYGAGVFVQGTFTMNAGTISNHGSEETPLAVEGTAVCLSGTKANFTMNGGQISSNYASSAGAGVSMRGGNISYPQFTMNGGKITENHTTGNVGGIVVRTGTFTMNDGATISNNTATKLAGGMSLETADKTTFIFNGGTFENNSAGNRGDDIYLTGKIILAKALLSDVSISPATYAEDTVIAIKGDNVAENEFQTSMQQIEVESNEDSQWYVDEEGFLKKGPVVLSSTGVGYATLNEAVSAATEGDIITIYRDTTVTQQISITTSLTITSNKAISITSAMTSNSAMFNIPSEKTLNITGGSTEQKINIGGLAGQNIIGNSGITNLTNVDITGGKRGVYIVEGTVNLTNVKISGCTDEGLRVDPGASVIAETITVENTGKQGLYFKGESATKKATATISNFNVSGTGSAAVRLMTYCDVTLTDGTITVVDTEGIATSKNSTLSITNVTIYASQSRIDAKKVLYVNDAYVANDHFGDNVIVSAKPDSDN